MKKELEYLTFQLDDFKDYKKEIEEIKELYTGLMKKKSIQKMLKKYLKNNKN